MSGSGHAHTVASWQSSILGEDVPVDVGRRSAVAAVRPSARGCVTPILLEDHCHWRAARRGPMDRGPCNRLFPRNCAVPAPISTRPRHLRTRVDTSGSSPCQLVRRGAQHGADGLPSGSRPCGHWSHAADLKYCHSRLSFPRPRIPALVACSRARTAPSCSPAFARMRTSWAKASTP